MSQSEHLVSQPAFQPESPAVKALVEAGDHDPAEARHKLIHVLQMAYSGEKSAALAYQGHAGSVRDPQEKADIAKIEADEWHHRERVGLMLAELEARPSAARELLQTSIGRFIKPACYVSGWVMPMIGAWLLEECNVEEYNRAAGYADALGHQTMAAELREMAVAEREHAEYFKGRVVTRKKRWGWL